MAASRRKWPLSRDRLAAAVVLVVLLVALDWRRPPDEQWSSHLAVGGIHLYQATLSKWYTRLGVQCRFTPTCSHYGEACIRRFGVARGGWLAMRRVLRCGPWTPSGTVDPPPRNIG
jgi:putative membrane protein insertion efficiency factor